jgi:hypothetical protein
MDDGSSPAFLHEPNAAVDIPQVSQSSGLRGLTRRSRPKRREGGRFTSSARSWALDLFFRLFRQASMGVAAIASPIGLPDICNDGVRMLVLSLQGSDERVLSLDREYLGA